MIEQPVHTRHSATLWARGIPYKIAIVDDGLDTDPTLLVFRNDEDEAIVTAHLDPNSACVEYAEHVIVRPPE